MPLAAKIQSLPSRYEPLARLFGDRTPSTFVESNEDLQWFSQFASRAESSGQGKIVFILGNSGQGKTTFLHSLPIFLSNKVSAIERIPSEAELPLAEIPQYISTIAAKNSFTIVNMDGREAPSFNEDDYRNFLISLNSTLRQRPDILIAWPINLRSFGERVVELLREIGGASSFGADAIYDLDGVEKQQYSAILDRIMQVANWRLEDAAIESGEIEELANSAPSVGSFLDSVQDLISRRFRDATATTSLPKLIISVSSGEKEVRRFCRSLRRADSYFLEASRLLMYTKRSNVAEWWAERSKQSDTALPFVVSLFDAQLVSVSASALCYAIRHGDDDELSESISSFQKNRGNARRVIASTELHKLLSGDTVDAREYGLNVDERTLEAYSVIQEQSQRKHKSINQAVVALCEDAGAPIANVEYEVDGGLPENTLQIDCRLQAAGEELSIEFHHKAAHETTENKIAIYVLEKLQEYAVNYGICPR